MTLNGHIAVTDNTGDVIDRVENIVAVVLCTRLLTQFGFKGVLPIDFEPDEDKPNPNNYGSAAGTLVHEMIHAIQTDGCKSN